MNVLNDFGVKIFLDRYALKDTKKETLVSGDVVVVCTNQKTRQREVGHVQELVANEGNKPRVRVKLLDGSVVEQDWDDVDKPLETTPEQTMARTARGIAGQEATPELQAEWTEKFKWLLDEWRFVPGGRILTAAGTDQNLTYFNCFDRTTPVHLETGIVEIGTLNGTYNVLSQDGVYRPAEFKSYGLQQLWQVELENGDLLYATADHQWVASKPKGGEWARVPTRDLVGRRIPVNPTPKPEVDADFYAGARNGIVYGDGTLASKGKTAQVYLFGEKMELEPYFDGLGSSHNHAEATESYPEHIRVIGLDASLKALPGTDKSASYWHGFISGLLATDGNVDDRGSCSIFSSSEDDLGYIADNMAKAGFVSASIRMTRLTSPYDGSDKPVYTLRLVKSTVVVEDLLRTSQQDNFVSSPVPHRASIRVVSVTPTDRVEEVFCCNEPATHTLTVGHGFLTGNCYVVPSPKDSRQGIVSTLQNMMEIMSRGGGVGINLSSLRPKHNYVKGVNGRSSGSISWGGLYSFVTGLIEQGGSRRGALMLILNVSHPDVLDFIDSKREAGKITNANISVAIPDAFMEAVNADADWQLVFPDTTCAAYDANWNGDLQAWQAHGYPVIVHKTVKARDLWTKIATSAWASAEPGILFIDRVNTMSNSHYFSKLICTNPCFPGDTRVHTSRGLVKASDLCASQENLNLVSDSRFGHSETLVPSTPVFLTAKSAQLYKITTVEGYEVRATADHRFMTTEGWKHLKDLREGDKIHIVNRGTVVPSDNEEGDSALGRILGWLVGDGFMHDGHGVVLSFYGDKRDLVPAFQQDVRTVIDVDLSPVTGHTTELRLSSTRLAAKVSDFGITTTADKVQVPELVFAGSTATQRGFLQALFSSDGTVADSGNGTRSVRLSSSKLKFLRDVQLLLLNFGVYSKIYHDRHEAGYRKMPDGNGGLASYFCQATHDLVVSKADIRTFYEAVGFLPGSSKQEQLRHLVIRYTFYKSNFLARVESVLPDGVEDVYDVTEPLNHSVVINGFVSHNCGEQPLPAWGICNLGAVNLGVHVGEDGAVLWDELAKTVRYAVRFLDNVIDATPYFIDENKKQQQRERRVGLGIMGLAEMLIRCGVRYGSDACSAFLDKLGQFIAVEAYKASSDYAVEKGVFPEFDADKLLDSGFMKGMPKSVRTLVKKQGLRNVTLLTVAPTGTTGTMVNTSTGVEPYFSWSYFRKSRLGVDEVEVDVVKDFRAKNPDVKELPDYFVSAMELTPDEHVKTQAALQRWIDSALSKTCNVPNEYTVDQVRELYELMYRTGCKGGTIYRDGSRDEQVLNLKADVPAVAPVPEPIIKEVIKEVIVEVPQVLKERKRTAKVMVGLDCKQPTHLGTCYTRVNYDTNFDPLEVFVQSGKTGSDIAALAEGLGRVVSAYLSVPSPVPPMDRLRTIAENLSDIGGSDSVGFGVEKIKSLPDAVGKSLYRIADDLEELKIKVGKMPTPDQERATPVAEVSTSMELHVQEAPAKPRRAARKSAPDLCPHCGSATYIREEGCKHCTSCGHNACG